MLRVSAALTSKRPMRAAAWRARTTSVSAHICCTSAATFSGSGSSWKAAGAVPGGPGRPSGQSRGAAPRHGHSAHSAALPGSWETVTPSVARPRWGHPARGHKAGNELMIKDLIAPPRFGNGDARAQPSVPSRALRRAPHVPSLGPQRDVGTRGDNPRGRGRPELCPPLSLDSAHPEAPAGSTPALAGCDGLHGHLPAQPRRAALPSLCHPPPLVGPPPSPGRG